MNADSEKAAIESAIRIGVSGLWRFYNDGFTRWPRDKLASRFSNLDLEHPQVAKEFKKLEELGLVKLLQTEICYLEVLRVPEC